MPDALPTQDDAIAREAVARVARRSYDDLVTLLAVRTRDVAGAEDSLSAAFVAALIDWPAKGVPRSPEAWLLTVARRKWIDAARRRRSEQDAADHLRLVAEEMEVAAAGSALPDGCLAVMFVCAHPALDPGIRAPLILQIVLGFDAATIGAAFRVSPAAMGQRLVRAKRKIREIGTPFQVPGRAELAARVDAAFEAIDAAFAKGRPERAGTEARRSRVARGAIWRDRLAACG